jgi:hypothetical protein
MRSRLVVLLALLVAACTPPGEQRRIWLSSLVGQSEVALIESLGVPTRTYEAGGVKFLAFTESWVDIVPPMAVYGPPYWGFSSGFPGQVVQWHCETTIAISGGVVRNFSFRGNAC